MSKVIQGIFHIIEFKDSFILSSLRNHSYYSVEWIIHIVMFKSKDISSQNPFQRNQPNFAIARYPVILDSTKQTFRMQVHRHIH